MRRGGANTPRPVFRTPAPLRPLFSRHLGTVTIGTRDVPALEVMEAIKAPDLQNAFWGWLDTIVDRVTTPEVISMLDPECMPPAAFLKSINASTVKTWLLIALEVNPAFSVATDYWIADRVQEEWLLKLMNQEEGAA